MSLASSFVSLLGFTRLVSAYTWPNPKLGELESLLYDQSGFNAQGGIVASAVNPCDAFNFGDTINRSNAADWIRTVRHLFYSQLYDASLHVSRISPRHTMTWPLTILKMALVDSTLPYSLNSAEQKWVPSLPKTIKIHFMYIRTSGTTPSTPSHIFNSR